MFIFDINSGKNLATKTPGSKSPPKVYISIFIIAVIILTLLKLEQYLKQTPEFAASISLIEGFAPLIGLFLLHILLIVVYIFFIDKVEKIFEKEIESFSRESSRKKIWRITRNDTTPLNFSYISLKEHSPPCNVLSR